MDSNDTLRANLIGIALAAAAEHQVKRELRLGAYLDGFLVGAAVGAKGKRYRRAVDEYHADWRAGFDAGKVATEHARHERQLWLEADALDGGFTRVPRCNKPVRAREGGPNLCDAEPGHGGRCYSRLLRRAP